jgi:D-alanyl-D-alanine carboxypeptidase
MSPERFSRNCLGRILAAEVKGATGKPTSAKSFSYEYADEWKQQDEIDLSIPAGAGAIISTPSDLVKFIQALFDGKVISPESVNQMKNGMGMSDLKLGDKTFYGHAGSMDGFRSMLLYLPEENLAVAYSSNWVVHPAQDIVRGALEIYQNKPFEIPTF